MLSLGRARSSIMLEEAAWPRQRSQALDFERLGPGSLPGQGAAWEAMKQTGPESPSFMYCRIGDNQWKTQEHDIGSVDLQPLGYASPQRLVIRQAAAVGGKLYFQETGGKLGVINFSAATPEFSFIDYPPLTPPDGSNCARGHLVESRGELFDVYVFFNGFSPNVQEVRVYKVDLSGPTRSEVSDLG